MAHRLYVVLKVKLRNSVQVDDLEADRRTVREADEPEPHLVFKACRKEESTHAALLGEACILKCLSRHTPCELLAKVGMREQRAKVAHDVALTGRDATLYKHDQRILVETRGRTITRQALRRIPLEDCACRATTPPCGHRGWFAPWHR